MRAARRPFQREFQTVPRDLPKLSRRDGTKRGEVCGPGLQVRVDVYICVDVDHFWLFIAVLLPTNTFTHINISFGTRRIFQLKVGGAPTDDIERIRAVRTILDVKVLHSVYGATDNILLCCYQCILFIVSFRLLSVVIY